MHTKVNIIFNNIIQVEKMIIIIQSNMDNFYENRRPNKSELNSQIPSIKTLSTASVDITSITNEFEITGIPSESYLL